jgi:hypothetical protein
MRRVRIPSLQIIFAALIRSNERLQSRTAAHSAWARCLQTPTSLASSLLTRRLQNTLRILPSCSNCVRFSKTPDLPKGMYLLLQLVYACRWNDTVYHTA